MIRETFTVGLLGCNCTILGDERTHEAIVVDPGDDVPRILAMLAKHNLRCTRIVVTHAHIDHIAAAAILKELTGAALYYHKDDLMLVGMMEQQAAWIGIKTPSVPPPDHSPAEGELIEAGDLRIEILLTPGHTQGSLCLYLSAHQLLLVGDTLFAGSIGRTDLPGGSTTMLLASIHERILPLPSSTVVIPGHGGETTIGREAVTNPFLV